MEKQIISDKIELVGENMKLDLLKALYQKYNLPETDYQLAVALLEDADSFWEKSSLDEITTVQLDELIEYWVKSERNTVPNFIVLMRYFKLIKRNDLFIHLTKYTGGLDVIENILETMKQEVGEEPTNEFARETAIPPLGTHPAEMPKFTSQFMIRLERKFDGKQLRKILAGNNHGIPAQAFVKEKEYYAKVENLEAYLKDLHQRKVAELQDYCNRNEVWFEQKITQEVVDFVASDQEILSAVLKNDKLYAKKIPYDIISYLHAKNKEEKAYYSCHCPFAREAVKDKKTTISPNWCYCSAGFEKYPFEVLFGKKLPIKVLHSILKGNLDCRFEISLVGIDYKK